MSVIRNRDMNGDMMRIFLTGANITTILIKCCAVNSRGGLQTRLCTYHMQDIPK